MSVKDSSACYFYAADAVHDETNTGNNYTHFIFNCASGFALSFYYYGDQAKVHTQENETLRFSTLTLRTRPSAVWYLFGLLFIITVNCPQIRRRQATCGHKASGEVAQ